MPWTPASLLAADPNAAPAAAIDWSAALRALQGDGPFALAAVGGRRAATPGQAFCFGYQAALRAMLPDVAVDRVAALCATESGGNHPRAIQTRLRDGALTGQKSFVTLGPVADRLVIIASTGLDTAGRNQLVGCVVDPRAHGVSLTPMPPLPFVPDVPHATLVLAGVQPDWVLPRDGYSGLLKPFRTVEDIYVHAALAAWLLGVAVDSGWPHDLQDALLAGLAALAHTATLHPSDPGTHRVLGGALATFDALVLQAEPHWPNAPAHQREMWARDRSLMRIASGARAARLARARALEPPENADAR